MQQCNMKDFIDYLLRDTDSPHVVIGPLVKQMTNGDRCSHFIIATSERGRGFRCDQVIGNEDDRRTVALGLALRPPIVIHDTESELYMIRFCEALWPGQRVTQLRKEIEAEFAAMDS